MAGFTTTKAVPMLALLAVLLLAIAAGGSQRVDAASAVSGGGFSETPQGRRLLSLTGCTSDANCTKQLQHAKSPKCCPNSLGLPSSCIDVGASDPSHCGSCTTICSFGTTCCTDKCVNRFTDPTNCGGCNKTCTGNLPCRQGMCGYGHFP